jgi:hypothetical protein
VVAKVRERLAIIKESAEMFFVERYVLKNVNEVEGKEWYQVEVSNRFTALES